MKVPLTKTIDASSLEEERKWRKKIIFRIYQDQVVGHEEGPTCAVCFLSIFIFVSREIIFLSRNFVSLLNPLSRMVFLIFAYLLLLNFTLHYVANF